MNSSARYVAIIMDGHSQWAERRDLPEKEGLLAGWETLKARLKDALDLGIEELTVLPPLSGPDRGLAEWIASDTQGLKNLGVRIRFIGRRNGVAAELIERIARTEGETAANARLTLFFALNYDGRDEIVDAARAFGDGGESGLHKHLYAPEMHDPDLLIRTFGERRLSGFPLWQCAYSELIFRSESWPDFDRIALEECLEEFISRQRRYGARL